MQTQTTEAPRKTHAPLWSSPLEYRGTTLPSDGAKVVRWIEQNAVYGEGDWFGQRVVLRPWQKRWLYRLYERRPDGRRRYRRALLGMGKANGKTPLAAWVGAYELMGDVHVSPRVIIGAASLKQANLVFGDLKTTITRSDTLRGLAEPYDLQILLKDRPGVAERIAAEAGTNDGARATAFIADELHEWEGRVERVYLIVDGAIAKRSGAFTFAITTAGVTGDSLLQSLYDHGKAVAQGVEDDEEFLFEWYEAGDCDLNDEKQWLEAVYAANPAAGDFNAIDNILHRFQTIPRFEFERYHLNRWTSSYNSWIPLDMWDACSAKPELEAGDEVYVGIDGASRRDAAAVYVVKTQSLDVVGRVWEPEREGEVIDPVLIENHCRELDRTYDVREFRYNPRLFERSAEMLMDEGLPMMEIPQTVPRKTQYSQALYDVVMEGRLRHGGDPTLRAHAAAAVAKDRGDGWTLEKLKSSVPALIATAMAVDGAVGQPEGDAGIDVISF